VVAGHVVRIQHVVLNAHGGVRPGSKEEWSGSERSSRVHTHTHAPGAARADNHDGGAVVDVVAVGAAALPALVLQVVLKACTNNRTQPQCEQGDWMASTPYPWGRPGERTPREGHSPRGCRLKPRHGNEYQTRIQGRERSQSDCGAWGERLMWPPAARERATNSAHSSASQEDRKR
jgi:hypothetical protein